MNHNIALVAKYMVTVVRNLPWRPRPETFMQEDSKVGPVIVDWPTEMGPKPTVAEVMSYEAAWQADRDANAYKDLRRKAIREAIPLHEELEAIREALRGDSAKLDTQNAKVDAIKAQHPKP